MSAEQSTESIEVAGVAPGDLTTIFRQHREECGLNINQVAEALCLSPKIITALETEQLDQLPEPPYVRGYLRSYAKFAEVDPSPMITAYEKLRGAEPNELDYHFVATSASYNKPSRISSGTLKLGLLALLLLLLAILFMIPSVRDWAGNTWDNFSQESNPGFTRENQTDNPLLTSSIPTPLPIDDIALSGNPAPAPIEGDIAANGPAVLTTEGNINFPSVEGEPASPENPATVPETPEEDSAVQADEADTKTDTEVPDGSSHLKMIFNDEVWMRIRDNEQKKLFEALSQKGDTKEMILPRPLVLRVGNAQKLDLIVDGEPLDLTPFIRGSVANFTIE